MNIQTLDYYLLKKDKFLFSKKLFSSFSDTGFFLLKNSPISETLLKKNRKLFEKFFKELDESIRNKYSFPDTGFQVGYTPMQIETGEFASVADYKHFYQIGDNYQSIFIPELPKLEETSNELFVQFRFLYTELMQCIALSLGLDEFYFDKEIGNSIMRNIHYPETDIPTNSDEAVTHGGNILGMCASKHTDIDDITLLHATDPGLELWFKNRWIPVLCKPDTIIVNTGDMMQHLTGGLFKSGVHRVVCEPGIERFSTPFFGHRNDNASVVPIKILGKYNKKKYPYKTEGEYLTQRLKDIGLIPA